MSLSGGSAAYIALVAAIYGETGSALWVSAAIFSSVVASVAAAPFAGWIGDRFDRRRVLIGADVAAASVSLAMAAMATHAAALVVLLGVSSVAQAPFEPASAAALPNVVPEADVSRANALVAATSAAGYLLGPLLGGAILAVGASPATLFVVDAGTFGFSALLVATIGRPFGSGSTQQHPGVWTGLQMIVRKRELRIPVLAGMVSLVGIGIVDVASYPLSIDLDGGAAGYGAMTALLGGGGLLGAALAGRVLRADPARVLVAAYAAGGAGLALAGAAPVLVIAFAGDGGRWCRPRTRGRRNRDDHPGASAGRCPRPRLRGAGRDRSRSLFRLRIRWRPAGPAHECSRRLCCGGGVRGCRCGHR